MSVGFIEWNRPGLCGAACAHMALHARAIVGSSTVDQESIWTSMKNITRTAGRRRRAAGRCRNNSPGCATCALVAPAPHCWWSYPTALRAALAAKVGPGTPVKVRRSASEPAANSIIRSSWRVRACPSCSSMADCIGSSSMIGTQLRKWSAFSTPPTKKPDWIDVDTWNDRMMVGGECGVYDDKYVVVEVG